MRSRVAPAVVPGCEPLTLRGRDGCALSTFDVVECRPGGWPAPWRPGTVVGEDLVARRILVRPAGQHGVVALSRRQVRLGPVPCPGPRHAPVIDDGTGRRRLPALAPLVRIGGVPQPVPKPAAPWRDDSYRAAVRRHPCCNPGCTTPSAHVEAHHAGEHGIGEKASDATCVPLCTLCHRSVTNTYAAPGLDRVETERLFARVAAKLVNAWLVRQSDQLIVVPVLRLVAALALVALGAGEQVAHG